MKKIIISALLLTLFLIAMPGIGGEKLFPRQVAEKFWTAIQEKNIPALRKTVASHSLEKEELATYLPSVIGFELGRVLIEEGRAWIETDIVLEGEEPVSIPLETVLIKESGQWKVLYEKTVAMSKASSDLTYFLDRISDLTVELTRKLNHSLEELQHSMPEIEQKMEEIEKKLKARLPEVKERFEELMQEIEELFESHQGAPPSGEERTI